MTLRYRPDVDGLRAIAVISVIAFHFSLPGLTGGYLGVDVFFVLSGYLITTIMWNEMQARDFSLARFYERRIRRIMPALLLVLGLSTVVAVAVLLPGDLIGYAKSLLATMTFLANVYFWRDTNYFAAGADQKPLLHMWSLGVEEQFYILFPFLLMLLARYAPLQTVRVLVALVGMSFAANVAMNMVGARSLAFYLLPARSWELGLGAVIAVLPATLAPGPRLAGVATFAGIGLLLGGLVFSGLWLGPVPEALPAVLGTALIVWGGTAQVTPVARALSVAPMLFFGRLSYSMYLWHWPITVFATYWLVRDLTLPETAAAFSLIVALSILSLRFIENPARARSMPFRRVAVRVSAATVVLALVAGLILVGRGLPGRLPHDAARINSAQGTNYRCALGDLMPFGGSRACRLHLPSGDVADTERVLFGNSHAQMYAPILRDLGRETNVPTLLVPMNACLPTPAINIDRDCAAQAERNLTSILALPQVKEVVIAFNWEIQSRVLIDRTGAPATFDAGLTAGLDDLLTRIAAAGKTAALVGPIPVPGYDLASELSRALAFGRDHVGPLDLPAATFSARYDAITAPLRARLGARFIEPHPALCDPITCRWIIDGRSVYSDSNHVAAAELSRFRPYFDPVLGE